MDQFKMCLVTLLSCTAFALVGNDWPAWRGPFATGVARQGNLPHAWGPSKNIRWKTPCLRPGKVHHDGWGDRVFLTQRLNGGKRRRP